MLLQVIQLNTHANVVRPRALHEHRHPHTGTPTHQLEQSRERKRRRKSRSPKRRGARNAQGGRGNRRPESSKVIAVTAAPATAPIPGSTVPPPDAERSTDGNVPESRQEGGPQGPPGQKANLQGGSQDALPTKSVLRGTAGAAGQHSAEGGPQSEESASAQASVSPTQRPGSRGGSRGGSQPSSESESRSPSRRSCALRLVHVSSLGGSWPPGTQR